jgi:hypothetical protein
MTWRRLEVRRNIADDAGREKQKLAQHPGAEDNQADHGRHDLGNERERHLLDLGYDLQDADDETNQHGQSQDRSANKQRIPE